MLINDVSRKLAEQVDTVVRMLLPAAKLTRGDYFVGSLKGDSGESMKIDGKGEFTGSWIDFNGGEKGDLLDLWSSVRGISLCDALVEAKRYLGICDDDIVSLRSKSWPTAIESGAIYEPVQDIGVVGNYMRWNRCIKLETLQKFKVSSKEPKEVLFPYYEDGQLSSVKHLKIARVDGKKDMIVLPKGAKPILFGWQAFPKDAIEVVITEGEIDAMTLDQYDLGYGILSVPFGGGRGRKQNWIDQEFERFQTFKTIYLCMDNDKSGKEATEEIIGRLGEERCKVVTLPFNDANECLMQNVPRDTIVDCFRNAKFQERSDIVTPLSCLDAVDALINGSEQDIKSYKMPFSGSEKKIVFRPNELTLWTGLNGHGKSQLISYLMASQVNQLARIFIASFELSLEQFLKRMAKQMTAENQPTRNQTKLAFKLLDGALWMYKHVGSTNREKMLEVMAYARKRYGVDVFVIDSLMKCGIGEDDFNTQKLFVESLCNFTRDNDCHIHLVVHPRKPQSEDYMPSKLDIKGSGGVSDLADNVISIWRHKKKEKLIRGEYTPKCIEEKNALLDSSDVVLCCDKQRHGDWEGSIDLWFDLPTYCYSDRPRCVPVPMIDLNVANIED